jgi:hypothetical protein
LTNGIGRGQSLWPTDIRRVVDRDKVRLLVGRQEIVASGRIGNGIA